MDMCCRLQYFARGVQVYSKQLRLALQGKTGDALKTEDVRPTSFLLACLRMLYKCCLVQHWNIMFILWWNTVTGGQMLLWTEGDIHSVISWFNNEALEQFLLPVLLNVNMFFDTTLQYVYCLLCSYCWWGWQERWRLQLVKYPASVISKTSALRTLSNLD